jgi:penicillin-binding protein 2
MAMRLTIKDNIRESRLFNERAAIALFITVLLLLFIGGRLVYLQVISHAHYTTLSDGNRISIVAVPPLRGFIYDRNGVLLAQNIPSFSLEIIPEQVGDLEHTIRRTAQDHRDQRRGYSSLLPATQAEAIVQQHYAALPSQ